MILAPLGFSHILYELMYLTLRKGFRELFGMLLLVEYSNALVYSMYAEIKLHSFDMLVPV